MADGQRTVGFGLQGPGWEHTSSDGGKRTYDYFGIGLQGKGCEVRVLLVGGREGHGILRAHAQ